jgi:hypothetical protein
MQHKPQQQGSSLAAGGDSPAAAAAAAAAASRQAGGQSAPSQPADFLQEFATRPDAAQLLPDLTVSFTAFQALWVEHVLPLTYVSREYEQYDHLAVYGPKSQEVDRQRAADGQETMSIEEQRSEAQLAYERRHVESLAEALFTPYHDSSSPSASSSNRSINDGGGSSSNGAQTAGAGARSEQQLPEPGRGCPVCAVEQKAGGFIAELAASRGASSSSSSSNSSSSSPKASTGLYDSFPVHWSDPYLMRRLLWDLLGRVKPTAQDWFRQHANMCPHCVDIVK